uniref:hydroxymethylglutaryl-CoA reductase (NADPH) n=1 Tax=viral metagenome TaxID=1070528 RepID=A0A6C0E3K6_9ZZZZ
MHHLFELILSAPQPVEEQVKQNKKQKKSNRKLHTFEEEFSTLEEAVKERRNYLEFITEKKVLHDLPYKDYPYEDVYQRCCENVIGYIPIPLGVAGPILVNNKEYYLPMATTEGTLVASTSRGAKAITESGGCYASVIKDSITRAPVIKCPHLREAISIKKYCEDHYDEIKTIFNSTSNYAKLHNIKPIIAGKYLYLRFQATTGDAMGMNMIGKGVETAVMYILSNFPKSKLKSISGNVCVDKKASAMNWIEGRGKSVVCECVIKEEVVKRVLKTTPDKLVELNYLKNMVGSSIAGTIGGNNAHASNIVSAMFLACGQDTAQIVESSHCMTLMEIADKKSTQKDLYVSVTMPCLEVGTVGGGTHLPTQSAMLDLLGVKGSHKTDCGKNARKLAKIIASGVLAGELSLMSALSKNEHMISHMKLNRK